MPPAPAALCISNRPAINRSSVTTQWCHETEARGNAVPRNVSHCPRGSHRMIDSGHERRNISLRDAAERDANRTLPRHHEYAVLLKLLCGPCGVLREHRHEETAVVTRILQLRSVRGGV